MGGLGVGTDQGKGRDDGIPATSHHRRSRSSSDRNGDSSGVWFQQSNGCNQSFSVASPASTRTCGSQTPLHRQSVNSSTSSSNHRSSLENDIQLLQLRLQQEKSMRLMLEKAIGRTSSTLSPGHRHFASQAKELISEIELLEEEVANREQHVLTLYRSIFEQCVTRPPSEQSSGMSSPAPIRNKTRKHPSIISSAFCSSKKFPLRALSLTSNSGKKEIKIKHALSCMGKADVFYENKTSHAMKVNLKSPMREKTSVQRTLKDHLHQCPSKLSGEMIRCMAAVYCWLYNKETTKSTELNTRQPPMILESCVASQLSSAENQSKSTVEIYSMPIDKKQFSRVSSAMSNYRAMVEQLERVNAREMEPKAQLAFWINIYNSLIMHAYLAYGIPHTSLRRLALFHKAAYNIGGLMVSANAIEHAVFCFHSPRVGGWVEAILSTAFWKKSGEERQVISSKLSIPNSQSLVCFSLCTGAFSDPVLRVYTASNVRDELERAKREFLQTNILVKKSKKVFLPKLLERFAREASIGSGSLLKFVCENVDRKLQDPIQKCLDSKNVKKASQIIEWLPYNSKFRYVLSQELATKPR